MKALRDRTGAAMMDCKAALEEAGGDIDKAVELLRVKGQASAEKRSGRATSEGTVASYIHAGGSPGVLVEVQCETDFVARNDDFQEFAREVAIHVAAAAPLYVSAEEIPDEAARGRAPGVRGEGQAGGQARERGSRGSSRASSASGPPDVVLLEQEHVRSDRYEGKTIEQLRADLAAKTGESNTVGTKSRNSNKTSPHPPRIARSPAGARSCTAVLQSATRWAARPSAVRPVQAR